LVFSRRTRLPYAAYFKAEADMCKDFSSLKEREKSDLRFFIKRENAGSLVLEKSQRKGFRRCAHSEWENVVAMISMRAVKRGKKKSKRTWGGERLEIIVFAWTRISTTRRKIIKKRYRRSHRVEGKGKVRIDSNGFGKRECCGCTK